MNNTAQRRVILEELHKVKIHPTADEVYEMARKRIPKISLATVYRNLEAMAKKGEILRLDIAGRRRRYDADLSQHYHLRCRNCGGVSDLPASVIAKISYDLEEVKGKNGIEDYTLEFRGICKRCRKEGVV
jgi:Fe2+ or Zn2+ uptake regulation protein